MSLAALHQVLAPAKLNLFLHVVGRRTDGYHLLQSVFVLIDWCDELHFDCRADGQLVRIDLGPSLPPDDLCLKAARLLQARSETRLGVTLSILKRIPSGAGLGGGSSDAASTLLALNRLWGLHWPRPRLLELGAELGADVPFFIGGHNALVEGIGERLTALELPKQWFAVVKPSESIATADIFADPGLDRNTDPVILTGSFEDAQRITDWVSGFGRNDLQPPAQQRCPEVAQAARWLEDRFGNSRMTGSGSAVFARAGTGDQPVAMLAVQDLAPGWEGRMCRSLDHHPLVGWAG